VFVCRHTDTPSAAGGAAGADGSDGADDP